MSLIPPQVHPHRPVPAQTFGDGGWSDGAVEMRKRLRILVRLGVLREARWEVVRGNEGVDVGR